jgi:hypothetical protein
MNQANLRSIVSAALASALLSVIPAALAQGGDPHAILDRGANATGLTGADVPAWHLKATYAFYDVTKDKQIGSGTFEEWYSGPWTWHRTYTEGKKMYASEWSTGHGKQFKDKDGKLDLNSLNQKVAFPLVDPVFQASNFKPTVDMTLQAGTFSGLVLNCVLAANPTAAAGGIDPDVLFPRLCFDVKDNTLKFVTTSTVMTVYTDFKPMGPRLVANKVEVRPYNKLGTALNITLLEPLSAADQAQLTPPASAVSIPYAHQPGDAPLVPVKVSECAYPMDARNNQEHGVVIIPVVIRKDGSVKHTGGTIGPYHLQQAGEECVEGYKFEPFKLDGEPVDVSDTILYDFENKAFNGKIGIGSQPTPPPPAPAKK